MSADHLLTAVADAITTAGLADVAELLDGGDHCQIGIPCRDVASVNELIAALVDHGLRVADSWRSASSFTLAVEIGGTG